MIRKVDLGEETKFLFRGGRLGSAAGTGAAAGWGRWGVRRAELALAHTSAAASSQGKRVNESFGGGAGRKEQQLAPSGPVTAGVGARGTTETRTWLWFVLESVPSALVSPQQKLQPFV